MRIERSIDYHAVVMNEALSALDREILRHIAILESDWCTIEEEFGKSKLRIADAFMKAIGFSPYMPENQTRNAEEQSLSENPLKTGFVYLMRNRRNGYTKIGWSKDPKFRERTLQSQEPEIELIGKWPGTFKDELVWQIRFSAKRIRGEWFDLSGKDIELLRRAMA